MIARKTIFSMILLSAVFSFGQTVCPAQNNRTANLYAAPARLFLNGDYRTAAEEENGRQIRERFYPLGWSKTGKFAYLVEPADEACGCYFADLVVQDLRTDKIVWQRKYEGAESGTETLQTYWAKNRRAFSRKLAEHGIVASKQFAVSGAPLNFEKDELTPELKVNTTGDAFELSGTVVLQMISKRKGAKTLYEKTYDPKKYEAFLDAELAGTLRSPFEPRAAVLLIETYRGYEGPPHTTRVRIVGADLTNGFR